MTIPYTYLIKWTKTNMKYYGVRYASGCYPEELFNFDISKPYVTSSNIVKLYREEHGEPDIIQIRRIFADHESAQLWETKFLSRIDAKNRLDFLNKTNNKSFDWLVGENNGMYGKTHTFESKSKISKSRLGKSSANAGITNKDRETLGWKPIPGKPKGSTHSEQAKNKRSSKMKGEPVHRNFKRPSGIPHSPEAKNKISIANSGKIPWNKGIKLEYTQPTKGIKRPRCSCIICKNEVDIGNLGRYHKHLPR
jgi:hypothetical protein